MDNNDSTSSADTVNPFLAALENPKTEPFSSCLKNLDKSTNETFIKSNDFQIQPFSSQTLGFFRPKPKGLVDGLSRFFTPTNKRKSRVAISSLGDSLTLDEEIQTSQAASNSFSGTPLCDQSTQNKKVGHSDFLTESKLKLRRDLPSTSSSPSTKQSSFSSASSTTSTSSVSLNQTVKPSGSGQLKNLFDGLSHLYTASTDSRKRGSKNSVNSASSPKRLCKKPSSTLIEKDFNSSSFCDRNSSTGDVFSKDKEVFEVEDEEEDKHGAFESDASSSFMSSECSLSNKKQDTFKIEGSLSTFAHSDTLSYSQLFSSVPETRIFGSSAIESKDDAADVSNTELKSELFIYLEIS